MCVALGMMNGARRWVCGAGVRRWSVWPCKGPKKQLSYIKSLPFLIMYNMLKINNFKINSYVLKKYAILIFQESNNFTFYQIYTKILSFMLQNKYLV